MAVTSHDIRQSLLDSNVEFRHLAEEHSRLDLQLEQLVKQPYRNSEDLALVSTLKKAKLRLKDQMERMIAQHQIGRVH
jgi:uncharacterized protein YdcH (DUF465 family)